MNVIDALAELQELDVEIRELEQKMKDIPEKKAREKAQLGGVHADYEIAKSHLEGIRKRVREAEEEEAELREKAEKVRRSQSTATSGKELEQTNIQIEALERDADAAANRALAISEDDLPKAESRVEQARAKAESAMGSLQPDLDQYDAMLEAVKERHAAMEAKRAEMRDRVKRDYSGNFLLYYERISTTRWPAVVKLSNEGVCEGCHMKQPPFVTQMVERNSMAAENGGAVKQVACTMCGRLLYQ